jgi:hypothetical protein
MTFMGKGTRQLRRAQANFAFRVKIGEYEVELNGTHEEVMKTIQELPGLMTNVHKAFETGKPKTVTTLTVKTEPPKKEEPARQKYPQIGRVESAAGAILKLLETDWGKWRPRTIDELSEGLKANGIDYSGKMLSGVLNGLEKNRKVRRWKTDAGYVYILAEEEALHVKVDP